MRASKSEVQHLSLQKDPLSVLRRFFRFKLLVSSRKDSTTLACLAPATRIRAHTGRCAIPPDLLLTQLQRGRRVGVKGDAQCAPDIGILDGKLPGQEDLRAILLGRKVARVKARVAAINDGVRLTGIENHCRPPDQGDSMTCKWKMQVEPSVLAQEEVAKGRATVLRAVMVVLRAAAGHQGDVTGGLHIL